MPNKARPRLAVFDPSSGPSGLSRYLEMLWPGLTEAFELIIIGDADGPYCNFPAQRFECLPRELCNPEWRPTSGEVGPSHHDGARTTRRRGVLSYGWRSLAPHSLKAAAGASRQAWQLGKIIRACQPDVTYVAICGDDYVGLATRFAGVRSVGTLHHLPPDNMRKGRGVIASLSFGALTRVIAVSRRVAEAWTIRYPQLAGRVVTVPNGIARPAAIGIARDQALTELGLADSTGPLLLAAGRLNEDKGFTHLIDAAAMMRQHLNDFTIAIAGTGPLEALLRERIMERGVQRHVRLLGQLTNLDSSFSVADGFILSSVSEAMPYVILEAMSYGVPVVATSVGGVPELVKNNETGLLVAPGQPSELAQAALRLIREAHRAREWAANAIRLVMNEFSVEEMRKRTVQVFWEAAATRHSGQRITRSLCRLLV